jgi:hypothetical protein
MATYYYTQAEINRLITGREAIKDKIYPMANGSTYIGIDDGFIRLKVGADDVTFAPTEINPATSVQEAIENIIPTVVKQVEINFGDTNYITQNEFNIVDSSIVATDKISAEIAYVAPTGKDLDELEMDSFIFICGAYEGGFKMLATALDGSVYGTFKINYSIN